VSKATFEKWKAKFGGMDVSDAQRLKALEAENAQLKQVVADQQLDFASDSLACGRRIRADSRGARRVE
jgi:putative transposase